MYVDSCYTPARKHFHSGNEENAILSGLVQLGTILLHFVPFLVVNVMLRFKSRGP